MHGSRHLASPGPSDCETDSPPLKSHSHTASAAPAASFKRPYQNCPDRISSRSSHRCRGRPDRVLSFIRTDFDVVPRRFWLSDIDLCDVAVSQGLDISNGRLAEESAVLAVKLA